ncbi:rod shape-determining protein MreD [bacterium]|nr:rod shape-determining protein MreD [bacterium]
MPGSLFKIKLIKDLSGAFLAIIAAFILHTLFSRISISYVLVFNIMNLVVLYFAVRKGERFGAGIGTVCGLIQDSFSSGVFGIGGLSKTLMGYGAGYISRKINVYPLSRNFVFLLVMLTSELIIWGLLYSFAFTENVNTGGGLIFFQPLGTGILGSLIFQVMRKFQVNFSH